MMSKIVIGTWPLSGDFGKISATKCQDVLEYCYERNWATILSHLKQESHPSC